MANIWNDPLEALLVTHVDDVANTVRYAVALSSAYDHRAVVTVLTGKAPTLQEAVVEMTEKFVLTTWATPVDLYTDYQRVFDSINQLRSSFPHIQPYLIAKVSKHRLYKDAKDALAEEEEQERAHTQNINPEFTTLAVDGSWSRYNKHGGWAVMDKSGRWYVRSGAHVNNATQTELEAIHLAVRKFKGPLKILSDCKQAIGLVINAKNTGGKSDSKIVNDIITAIGPRTVILNWVPSHEGLALNEGANRLAVAARRGFTARLPRDTLKDTCSYIVDETLAAEGKVEPSVRPVSSQMKSPVYHKSSN